MERKDTVQADSGAIATLRDKEQMQQALRHTQKQLPLHMTTLLLKALDIPLHGHLNPSEQLSGPHDVACHRGCIAHHRWGMLVLLI